MPWDPDQYDLFSGPRTRPAFDLLRSIDYRDPQYVVDLGCGTGRVTARLAERWPEALVEGIDNSRSMLERARRLDARVTWIDADIATWEPHREVDILFSNAAWQWVDDHPGLIRRLADTLSERAVLAAQMPDNHREPSHQVAFRLARESPWKGSLDPVMRTVPVLAPDEYLALLEPHFDTIAIWRTTYMQILAGEHAVADWVQGSFLKPFLDALDGEEAAAFLAAYRTLIEPEYARLADGRTLFPFWRLFLVAERRPG